MLVILAHPMQNVKVLLKAHLSVDWANQKRHKPTSQIQKESEHELQHILALSNPPLSAKLGAGA
jgi:hypothetical protein